MPRSYESRRDVLVVPPTRDDAQYPQPIDAHTLAIALNSNVSALWYFVLHAHALYTRHTIPKKSGGIRTLHVPDPRLARAQTKILRTFLNQVEYPPWVSAYVPGRAPIEAAAIHAGRPLLIVLDLKDFFPSTRRSWVRDAFQKEFGVTRGVAELLATLVTAPWTPNEKQRFVVPQGAPTSGAAANIVAMHRLDPRILRICERYGTDYTRYADDLAFSRPANMSRDETSAFVSEIVEAIKCSGYAVNYEKIRVQRQNRQQRLLGMCINVRPNLPKSSYRKLRAIVHHVEQHGLEETTARNGYATGAELENYLLGVMSYAVGLSPTRISGLRNRLVGAPPEGPLPEPQGP